MNFCSSYDKQLAKQEPPPVLTPLLAGWEFWQRSILSSDKAGWLSIAQRQGWVITKSILADLENEKWAVIITDSEQIIQYVNVQFEQMTGYVREEIIGNRPAMFQGQATSTIGRQRIREALTNRKPISGQLLNYRKDRTPYWCQIKIRPILNRQKQLVNFIAFERETALQ
ncbi:PAS domain-containing protein [Spirosoma daeguense]